MSDKTSKGLKTVPVDTSDLQLEDTPSEVSVETPQKQDPPIQPPEPEKFVPYKGTVKSPTLNVRKGPGKGYEVLTVLMNDKKIYDIIGEETDENGTKWGQLKTLLGWVSLDYFSKLRT